jgi:signal transduction histidine kinase
VLNQTSWRQRALLALAVAVPFCLVALFAFYQRGQAIAEAHESANRSVVALEQHAANLLDAHSLILRQVNLLVHGRSWDQLRNDELLRLALLEFSRDPAQVAAIGIADAAGNVITGTAGVTSSAGSIAGLDYFVAHKRAAATGIFVGEAFTARSGERQFALSLPRTTPSGEFAGVVFTTVPLAHFVNFWKDFTPSGGHLIPMVRPDGALIVRYPRTDSPQHLDPRGPFISHLSRSRKGLYTAVSLVDGVERINAYSQVKDYPLFLSYSVETGTVLQEWRRHVLVAAALGAVASALLAALWFTAVRQSHLHRSAAQQWEDAARALQAEISLREQAQESMRLGAQRLSFGDQLIGIVSHDLRNPLNTISLTAAVMARRGKLGPQEAQLVQRIQNSTERAARLIGDLLDFTQARLRGRIPVHPRQVDVHELLRGVLVELETAHPGRIEHSLAAGDPQGEWDPDRLSQVVENLVTNALKYGAAEGSVLVTTRSDGGDLVLEVHNDGTPIPPDKLEAIFEPLQRAAEANQPNPDRSIGMGLYIVKHIVEAHHGAMRVESTAEQGTTFVVRLPRAR